MFCTKRTSSRDVGNRKIQPQNANSRYFFEEDVDERGVRQPFSKNPDYMPKYPPKENITSDQAWDRFDFFHKNPVVNMEAAGDLAGCYLTYGLILRRATDSLKREASRVKSSPDRTQVVLHEPLSNQKALAAVRNAYETLSSEEGKEDRDWAQKMASINTFNGCTVPSPTGVMNRDWSWSCGSIQVDPEARIAKMNGSTIFGAGSIMGNKVTIAVTNASSVTNTRSNSSAFVFSSSEDRADTQSVGMGKTKTLSVSKSSTTAKSNTNSLNVAP